MRNNPATTIAMCLVGLSVHVFDPPAAAADGDRPVLQPLDESLDTFTNAFNASVGDARIVALLSPTCGVCIEGAHAIRRAALDEHDDEGLRVFIVWIPILRDDDEAAAERSAAIFEGNARVTQFYDGDQRLGDAIAKQLLNPGAGLAWDIYLFYDRNASWGDTPPAPAEWWHQLSGGRRADPARYRRGEDLIASVRSSTAQVLGAAANTGAHAPQPMSIEFLRFGSCPNHAAMRAALDEALASLPSPLDVRAVDLEALDEDDPRRGWGSPTILVNGKDLFDDPGRAASLTCRLYRGGLPSAAEIERRLRSQTSRR